MAAVEGKNQGLDRAWRYGLLLIGAAIYGTHLALMPGLVGTPLIWALPVLAGLGGAVLIIMPIGYYQDLMEGQPGTAGALMAVQRVATPASVTPAPESTATVAPFRAWRGLQLFIARNRQGHHESGAII